MRPDRSGSSISSNARRRPAPNRSTPPADAVALMAEARRRAHAQFGVALEHEVVFLGDIELPALDT